MENNDITILGQHGWLGGRQEPQHYCNYENMLGFVPQPNLPSYNS